MVTPRIAVRRVVLIVAVLFVSVSVPAWASVARTGAGSLEASVDRRVIRDGETVALILQHRGDDALDSGPDLTPLERDFDLLDSRQSQRTSIINGQIDRSVDWMVQLAPRKTGELTIPAIRWGAATSAPLTVRVADGSPGHAPGAPDLFVEASVDSAAPYVNGQVTYTVHVYDAVGVRDATLTQPAADGVRVEPVGEARSYDAEVQGRSYHVYERTFALFPESSGEVTVTPVTLRARVLDRGRGRSPFGGSLFDDFFDDSLFGRGFPSATSLFDDVFNPGRPVQVRSKAIVLSVQERPDGAGSGWFLPAADVTLAEAWTPERPTFRVGEPVTRTFTLQARGASAEQLPELEIPAADGVRQYPEKPTERTIPADDGMLSIRKQAVAVVPTRAGTTTLPSVEVRWWDVKSKAMRTAAVPAQTIEVLPGAGPAEAPPPAAATATEPSPARAPVDGEPSRSWLPSGIRSLESIRPMLAPLIIAVSLLVVGTAGLWIVRRRRRRASDGALPAGPPPRQLVEGVRAACAAGDPRAARDAVMAWARGTWPGKPPATLHAVTRQLHHVGFTEAVRDLDRCLYGAEESRWEGQALWRAFEAARTAVPTPTSPRSVLPDLYPKAGGSSYRPGATDPELYQA